MEQLIIPRDLKKEKLTNFLEEKLSELADNICQSPDELKSFSEKWRLGFHDYSFKNTLLILSQRPDATLVAGYRAWQERNRQVMKNEFGIRIFAPNIRKVHKTDENGEEEDEVIITGFRPTTVFAIQQTAIFRSFVANGSYFNDILDPSPVFYPELGCSDLISGGTLDFDKIKEAIPVPVVLQDCGCSNGKTDGKTIYITPKENKSSQLNTLFHEYAHVLLDLNDNEVLYDSESRSVAEITAESVAFIVSSYFRIKNEKSHLYIANWGADSEKLRGHGKSIITTAEYIIRLIREAVQ